MAGVDLTLQRQADGAIAPVSPVDALALSGGGSGSGDDPLLTLSDGTGASASSVSLAWPDGDLPVPVLAGATATYPDVRPDEDLVITATRDGFEQSLVLKSAPASAADARLVLPISSDGMFFANRSAADDAPVDVVSKAGKTLGAVGQSLVTDAQETAGGAPANESVADQAVQTVDGVKSLVIEPDQAYLDSAVYPVTIDPSVSLHPGSDTYVDSGYPDQNYASSTLLHVGTWNAGTNKARAFFKYHNIPISGTQILSSSLKLWEEHAYSCTSASFTVYPANPAIDNPDITWNNQPGISTVASASASSNLGAGRRARPAG